MSIVEYEKFVVVVVDMLGAAISCCGMTDADKDIPFDLQNYACFQIK